MVETRSRPSSAQNELRDLDGNWEDTDSEQVARSAKREMSTDDDEVTRAIDRDAILRKHFASSRQQQAQPRTPPPETGDADDDEVTRAIDRDAILRKHFASSTSEPVRPKTSDSPAALSAKPSGHPETPQPSRRDAKGPLAEPGTRVSVSTDSVPDHVTAQPDRAATSGTQGGAPRPDHTLGSQTATASRRRRPRGEAATPQGDPEAPEIEITAPSSVPVATRRRDGRGRTAVTLLMVGVTALLGSAAGTVAAHTWKLPQLFVRPSATASVRNARMDSGAAKASTTSAPPSFAPPAGNDASRLRKLAAAKPRMRTAAQTLAVARYRIDADEGRLTDLRRRLDTDPHATLQSDGVEMLLEGARDPTTALAALEVMASLPGSQGPDLIYEVWVSAEEGSRIRQVADELLHSHDVYKKSSNALKVVSDLSEPHDCQEYPAVLKRAGRQGDQRARAGLRKLLLPRNECGANGKQDCHRCIPKATLIKALNDCTQRKPPQL